MGASGLLVLGSVTHDTGVVGFLIGLSLALLPLPVVIGALRWLDRYEPEPRGVLLFAFFWGATVAALVAAVLNTASLIAIARTGGGSGMDTTAVLVAPWVEEAAKGAAVLLVLLFRRQRVRRRGRRHRAGRAVRRSASRSPRTSSTSAGRSWPARSRA